MADKVISAEQKQAVELYVALAKARTAEEKEKILAGSQVDGSTKDRVVVLLKKTEAKPLFFGEAAIALGFTDKDRLDAALTAQAASKAAAASADLMLIAEKGKIEHPPFLKANWGNGAINKPSENPTVADGAIAAANVAQNIVMMVGDGKPELAKNETIQKGVVAAQLLAQGIAGKIPLSADEVKALQDKAKEALTLAATETRMGPKAKEDARDLLPEYIEARFAEIQSGADQRIAVQRAAQAEKGAGAAAVGAPSEVDAPTTPVQGEARKDSGRNVPGGGM